MTNLFENITKKLVDKIDYLSTQIQDYFDINSILTTIEFNEDETETKKKQLEKQETYFEKLYELYSRSNIVVESQIELNQYIEILQRMTDNFFSEFKQRRENVALQMNELLNKMKETEKYLKQKIFTENYQEMNFNDYFVETEKEKREKEEEKEKEIQKEKEREEQLKEEEKERIESDENEQKFWKMKETNEKNEKQQRKEEKRKKQIETFDEFVSEKEIELIENETKRKFVDIIFDSNKENWNEINTTFSMKMKDKSHFIIFIETVNGKKFGCFINEPINKLNEFICDKNAFIFKIKRNHLTTYKIKDNQKAIRINGNENKVIFSVGEGDIVINCFEKKNECFCNQISFDYHDNDNVLLERKNNSFEIEQFVIIQMKKNREEQREQSIRTNEMFIEKHSVEIIEEWCDLKLKNIIFDSNYDDWNKETSIFDQRIFGKQNLVFLMEDTERNIFGSFISSSINDHRIFEDNQWKGRNIVDKNSFIFSLQSNGRLDKPEKFMIKENDGEWALQLFDSNLEYLFLIGGGSDICIMKKDMKNQCYCKQNSFDYNGKENVLVGKEGFENPFVLNRIQVWQMIETKEQKQQKEEIEKNLFDEELKKLQQETLLVPINRKEDIKKLEVVTRTTFDRVVFDTEYCDWDINTTQIEKHLLGREKLVFIIEDTNDNVFGGFVNEKVDGIYYEEKNERKGKQIRDDNSILFTLKSNGRVNNRNQFQYFRMKKENNISFNLYRKDMNMLFVFGFPDIVIFKKFKMNQSYCDTYSYNYQGNETVLTGSIGSQHPFDIKRIQIWQMKITNSLEKRLEKYKTEEYENESNQLKERTKSLKENKSQEIETIEKLCDLVLNEIVFDSDICEWSIGRSSFDKRIFNKINLVFVIEDTEGNVFGCFVNNKINSILYKENEYWKGNSINDKNSFIFSLQSNERNNDVNSNNKANKYMIKQEYSDCAFRLFENTEKQLFYVGGNDICVMKQEMKNESYCQHQGFEYNNNDDNDRNVLIGKEGKYNSFTVKRIQVYQMIQSDKEMKKSLKTEKEIEKQREQLFETEQKLLKEKQIEMEEIYQQQILLFEEWTELKCKSLLFDSDCCNWKLNTSTFDKHLLNKENVIFFFEDNNGNEFGAFIKNKINSIRSEENGVWSGNIITDKNAFIFSMKSTNNLNENDHQPQIFMIKNDHSSWAFQLYKSTRHDLLSFGGGSDIYIMKEQFKANCFCNPISFDYNGKEDILIGTYGTDNPFTVKRILCWQMIESDDQREQQNKGFNQKIIEENNQLIDSTINTKKNQINEIRQIEQWTNTTFDKVIFDTECCDWKMNTSTFNKHINGNNYCAFVIEDSENNVFGGFISEKIDLKKLETSEWYLLTDKNSFIFSFKSNGRLSNPMKFPIHPLKTEYAYQSMKEENWLLFIIGQSDIIIAKEEFAKTSYCCFTSFKCDEYAPLIIGKENVNQQLEIKRIQVWKFTLSEEQMKQREEEKIRQKQIHLNLINEEKRQLEILSQNIMNEFHYEIDEIETWSQLKSKSILFDSQFCDWSFETSTFVDHIMNKQKLAFLIVTETGVKYGGFLYSKVKSYSYNEITNEMDGSVDPKSFVFTFKDYDPKKFNLKKEYKDKSTFYLNTDENCAELFVFGPCGYHDIWVGKKDLLAFCCQNKQNSYYNFIGFKNALTGISGEEYMENQFGIKRFVVIQFQ